MNNDNIVAITTAHGHAGVGIVRISGKQLLDIIPFLTNKTVITARNTIHCHLIDKNGLPIDSVLLIYFKAPASFTGEDIIEIHGHGNPIVLQMILKRCIELGCRLAKPGEFSYRAYLNNKIDLVQAESIIDLIHAESESSAKSALNSLQGKFSQYINAINQQLIHLRMFVEASLDFPEEDIEFIIEAKIREKLQILQNDIKTLLKNTKQGVIINNGANIAIIGRPNVGKSSILNLLANEDIAIVTDIAGTTRDVIKEKILINGISFNLIDTAGIRNTIDIVEKIGIERSIKTANEAHLCLVIIDALVGITAEDQKILTQIPKTTPYLFIYNKSDLLNDDHPNNIEQNSLFVSAKTGDGIDNLRNTILQIIGIDNQNNYHNTFTARTRHLNAIQQTVTHIDLAFTNWENLELLAEELRYAHNKLATVTGEFSTEDLLGEIFSKFCIGK